LRTVAAWLRRAWSSFLFDDLGALPLFNPDLEASGVPAPVEAWRRRARRERWPLDRIAGVRSQLARLTEERDRWVIGFGRELERKVVAITAAVPAPERGRLGSKALRDTLGAVSAIIVEGTDRAGPNFAHETASCYGPLVSEFAPHRENPGS